MSLIGQQMLLLLSIIIMMIIIIITITYVTMNHFSAKSFIITTEYVSLSVLRKIYKSSLSILHVYYDTLH